MSNILNKEALLDMIRLKPDKYVTRSKMYIKNDDGGYKMWKNPTTNEEEILTLKRELLNVKREEMKKSDLNELLIRIIFYHEIVLKSATNSVKDPGHESAIDSLLTNVQKTKKNKLNRKSLLPKKEFLSPGFKNLRILKNNYHPPDFNTFTENARDQKNTYLNEDLLIRNEDISLSEMEVPDITGIDKYNIGNAIYILNNMLSLYKEVKKILSNYENSNIIFNNYTYDTVQGMRNKEKGNKKGEKWIEDSRLIIDKLKNKRNKYNSLLSNFNDTAKVIMSNIMKEIDRREKKRYQGRMLSVGENVYILQHYLGNFFNLINESLDTVKTSLKSEKSSGQIFKRSGTSPTYRPSSTSPNNNYNNNNKKDDNIDWDSLKNVTFLPIEKDGKAYARSESNEKINEIKDVPKMVPRNIDKKKKKKKKKEGEKGPSEEEFLNDAISRAKREAEHIKEAKEERVDRLMKEKRDAYNELRKAIYVEGPILKQFKDLILDNGNFKYFDGGEEEFVTEIRQALTNEKSHIRLMLGLLERFTEAQNTELGQYDHSGMNLSLYTMANEGEFAGRSGAYTLAGQYVEERNPTNEFHRFQYKGEMIKVEIQNPEFGVDDNIRLVPHGFGVLYHENFGNIYIGNWYRGYFQGKGIFVTENNWVIFQGSFFKGDIIGGTRFQCEPKKPWEVSTYTGQMYRYTSHGFGTIRYSKTFSRVLGLINYTGSFIMGKREGFGDLTYTEPSGEIRMHRGIFSDGRRMGEGKVFNLLGDLEYSTGHEGLFMEEIEPEGKNILDGPDNMEYIPMNVWSIMKKMYLKKRIEFLGENVHENTKSYTNNSYLPQDFINKWSGILIRYLNLVNVGGNITLNEEIASKMTNKCEIILDFLEKSYVSHIVIKENVTWSSWDEWNENYASMWGTVEDMQKYLHDVDSPNVDMRIPKELEEQLLITKINAKTFIKEYYKKLPTYLEDLEQHREWHGHLMRLPAPVSIKGLESSNLSMIDHRLINVIEMEFSTPEERAKFSKIEHELDEKLKVMSKMKNDIAKFSKGLNKLFNDINSLLVLVNHINKNYRTNKVRKKNKDVKKLLLEVEKSTKELVFNQAVSKDNIEIYTERLKKGKIVYVTKLREYLTLKKAVDQEMMNLAANYEKDDNNNNNNTKKQKKKKKGKKKRGGTRKQQKRLLEDFKMEGYSGQQESTADASDMMAEWLPLSTLPDNTTNQQMEQLINNQTQDNNGHFWQRLKCQTQYPCNPNGGKSFQLFYGPEQDWDNNTMEEINDEWDDLPGYKRCPLCIANNVGNDDIDPNLRGGAHGFQRNQLIAVRTDLLPQERVQAQLRIIEILPPEEGEEAMGDRMIVEDPTNSIRLNVHADVLWNAGWRPLSRIDSSKSGAGRKNRTLKKGKKGGAYSELAKKLMKRRTRKKLHPLHKNAKIIQQAYRDYIKKKRESERMTDDQWEELKNKYSNMSYQDMMDEDY